ncbi:hypothetical protein Bca4012_005970 [Brassica carinata]
MSELATYILCGAECRDVCISTHIGGVRGSRDVWTSDAYYIIVYPYEENAGCVVLCTESVVCGLAFHTSLGDSPVAHPSFFPLQVGIIMYLPTADPRQRKDITDEFYHYRRLTQTQLWDQYSAYEHWAKSETYISWLMHGLEVVPGLYV